MMTSRLKERSILIVEDEVMIADCLAMIVEDDGGMVVGPAPSVLQAIRHLDGEQVNAAILDVNLRDGEVTPLIGLLKEREIPFIIHTGGILPARLRDAIGLAPVFSKPTPYDIMILTLENLLAERETRRAQHGALGHALIIEDDDVIAVVVETLLSRLGYQSIDRAATEAGAVASAERHKPDLMIVDICLAEGSGLDAVATIRSSLGEVPVLFMTAYPDMMTGLDSLPVLRKPFTAAGIQAAVVATLESCR